MSSVIDNQRDFKDFVIPNIPIANVYLNGVKIGYYTNKDNIIKSSPGVKGFFSRNENDFQPDQGAGKLLNSLKK